MLARSQFNYSMSHDMFGQNFFFDLPNELQKIIRNESKKSEKWDIDGCEDIARDMRANLQIAEENVEMANYMRDTAYDNLAEQEHLNRNLRRNSAISNLAWAVHDQGGVLTVGGIPA